MAKKQSKAKSAPAAKVEQAPEAPPKKVPFDLWYAMRQLSIPRHHAKAVLAADFQAQGLSTCEALEAYDAALARYGVKLA